MDDEFSLESVRQFIIMQGGKTTNHELVRHFKKFLTDPIQKDEARAQFRDYVNILASVKQEGNEKFLVLKKKYVHNEELPLATSASYDSLATLELQECYTPPRSDPSARSANSFVESRTSPLKNVPSSRNPICLTDDEVFSLELQSEEKAVSAPPRKKQVSRTTGCETQNKENEPAAHHSSKEERLSIAEEPAAISVKERTQKFNRLASQTGLTSMGGRGPNAVRGSTRSRSKHIGEDDDTSSLATMDPRAREWIVACARGEYNHIAKLLQEEPRLAKRRDCITVRRNL
ncbi:ankyrin repeat domain-containing protein SOWAHA-like [Artemia franciscana]|uniref:ankyrin repeat domain-containing protein SOWAHA-like n=1 Tax=Artemia franciscana TaxID=6661 RepID=UPI0032DAF8C7